MEIGKSDVILSAAGRDKGKAFFVIDADERFVTIADGKSRKLEKPKRKKKIHIRFLAKSGCRVGEKLRTGEKVQNSEIRRALLAYAGEEPGQTQGGL